MKVSSIVHELGLRWLQNILRGNWPGVLDRFLLTRDVACLLDASVKQSGDDNW